MDFLTTNEYVWVDRVRYSALQTPIQSSTGPPGEWGRRASAMSQTILWAQVWSQNTLNTSYSQQQPSSTLTSQHWRIAMAQGYSGPQPPGHVQSPSLEDLSSPLRWSPGSHPHEVLSEGQSVEVGGRGQKRYILNTVVISLFSHPGFICWWFKLYSYTCVLIFMVMVFILYLYLHIQLKQQGNEIHITFFSLPGKLKFYCLGHLKLPIIVLE